MKNGKRINGDGIAMLLDLDDCLGCFGCEVACRETNRYGYDETWMETVRRKPVMVDGKLRQYHLVAPPLDKCRMCYNGNPEPLCVTGCPGKALFIGSIQDMIAESEGRHCTIFTA